MKFEHTEIWGFEHAIRGMRNPMESWDKSDSSYDSKGSQFFIGDKDLELMHKLIKAGAEHRKFLRQILVSVDITAPLYWWKEFDTYKIGTVSNSCSTMHKLASTPITLDCFELVSVDLCEPIKQFFKELEAIRLKYNALKIMDPEKAKCYWKVLIQLLPEAWLQKRTVTMNYENVANMYSQRLHHKLSEWSVSFIQWADKLPHFKELFIL